MGARTARPFLCPGDGCRALRHPAVAAGRWVHRTCPGQRDIRPNDRRNGGKCTVRGAHGARRNAKRSARNTARLDRPRGSSAHSNRHASIRMRATFAPHQETVAFRASGTAPLARRRRGRASRSSVSDAAARSMRRACLSRRAKDARIAFAISSKDARSTHSMSSRRLRGECRERPARPPRRMPTDSGIRPRPARRRRNRKKYFRAFTRHWGIRRSLLELA
jgi:hypothetical protein